MISIKYQSINILCKIDVKYGDETTVCSKDVYYPIINFTINFI